MAKLLIIEDDPHTARLMKVTLSRAGYDVTIAPNGLVGLKVARDEPLDLILLDLMLPGLDGFEILSQIRANPKTEDLPVIIVSAKSRVADQKTAKQLGANGYLIKPYKPDQMLSLIGALLGGRTEAEAEDEDETAPRGIAVALVGQHSADVTMVALFTGLALAEQGETALAVDFRPLSIEHPMRLSVPPPPHPIALSDPGILEQLANLTVQHPNGLKMLNNLEGRGSVGQLLPDDVDEVLDGALAQEGFVLLDLPIYPNELLQNAGTRCAAVLLVAPSGPTALSSARTIFTILERSGLPSERMGIVLTQMDGASAPEGLPRPVLGHIPPKAEASAPAFQELANRLRALQQGKTVEEMAV